MEETQTASEGKDGNLRSRIQFVQKRQNLFSDKNLVLRFGVEGIEKEDVKLVGERGGGTLETAPFGSGGMATCTMGADTAAECSSKKSRVCGLPFSLTEKSDLGMPVAM